MYQTLEKIKKKTLEIIEDQFHELYDEYSANMK